MTHREFLPYLTIRSDDDVKSRRLTMLQIRIRLHFDVHLSYREVARALGITHGTVSQCIQRFKAAGVIPE